MTRRHRNAVSGRFAAARDADADPERHVAETVREPVSVSIEWMSPHFMKAHLHGTGLVLHRFTAADGPDSAFHDHPFSADIRILHGGYVEQVLDLTNPEAPPREIERRAGDNFRNEAGTVHRIIRLLDGETWTEFRPGPHERKSGFYEVRDGSVFHRFWDQPEFTRLP